MDLFERVSAYLAYIARNHKWLFLIFLFSFFPFIFFLFDVLFGAPFLFSLWFALSSFLSIFALFLYLTNYLTALAVALEIASLLSHALRLTALHQSFYRKGSFWIFFSFLLFMAVRELYSASKGRGP